MRLEEIEVSLDGFEHLDLNKILSGTNCGLFTEIEMTLAAYEENPELCLLRVACSIYFDSSLPQSPFKPKFVFEGRRGILPEDFREEQLQILNEYYIKIENAELRARLADILWVTKTGGVTNAYVAIDSYLESAKKLASSSESCGYTFQRIERALRLSNMFRREKQRPDLFNKVSELLLHEFELSKAGGNFYYTLKLLALCNNFGINSDEWNYEQLILLAEFAEKAGGFDGAISAYEIAIDVSLSLRDKEKENSCWKALSDCHVKYAKNEQTGLITSGRLLKAIDALAKVPGTKKQRLELYEEMREHQVESLNHLGRYISEEQDISKLVEYAVERVQGVDFQDIIFRFATVSQPVDLVRLKDETLTRMPSSFTWMFGSKHLDHQGMTTAVVAGGEGPGEDDVGGKCWEEMMKNLQIHHQLSVEGEIIPALNEINKKLYITHSGIECFCNNHPFIPDGHQEFFIKGLLAGFEKDFLTACHLLIPQVENSLRYLVRQSGEEPSTLHGDGSQERDGIKAMLNHSFIIERLGVNLTSELKIILLDKIYGDLRNQMSHGYAPSSSYRGFSAAYFWWLVLFIIMAPYSSSWKEKYNTEG
ncbi:DUF4209 domain-containing protein [Buttiauxella sp. B2]|uniref:DUF7380 domain-containing protein n=1 Tax=Buttiauxella sp. B2 TaxID=2587812 RepID=UPI00111F66B1|nr:DUF4209 domain-containing protein [Buttiauxella sp. B2]TNV22847.1 DUF4209 domain-containing protein [Buttiauxella sp. B2]